MKRIIDTEEELEDKVIESSIRPLSISEYIGQSEVKDNIKGKIFIIYINIQDMFMSTWHKIFFKNMKDAQTVWKHFYEFIFN